MKTKLCPLPHPSTFRPEGGRLDTGRHGGGYECFLPGILPCVCRLPFFRAHPVCKLMATSLCPLKLTMTSATSMVRATWQLPTAAEPPASPEIRTGCWSLSSTSTSASRSTISGLSRWVPVSPSVAPIPRFSVCAYANFSAAKFAPTGSRGKALRPHSAAEQRAKTLPAVGRKHWVARRTSIRSQ